MEDGVEVTEYLLRSTTLVHKWVVLGVLILASLTVALAPFPVVIAMEGIG